MRVLVIKTSSLGDVLHTLPALTDAARALPEIRFDWVVEEAFAEIPAWHPAVDTVIPVALRRWRKQPVQALHSGEWRRFRTALREQEYAKVIDAQGLIKSAVLTRMARGRRCGLDCASARESLAALAYQERYAIPKGQQALQRLRRLFAAALGYDAPAELPDYGILRGRPPHDPSSKAIVFLHGTTWSSKLWPDAYWLRLAQLANEAGYRVLLPWGNAVELTRVQQIARATRDCEILPRLGVAQLADVLAAARGVVGLDTGLTYLALALGVPTVAIYGATRPEFSAVPGQGQFYTRAEFVCSPCMSRTCLYPGAASIKPACYESLPPDKVWETARLAFNVPSQ